LARSLSRSLALSRSLSLALSLSLSLALYLSISLSLSRSRSLSLSLSLSFSRTWCDDFLFDIEVGLAGRLLSLSLIIAHSDEEHAIELLDMFSRFLPHPKPETRDPKSETPKPETRNPKPETPKPETRNPKPETPKPERAPRNVRLVNPEPGGQV
ncbi:hypothetical protein T484DRAFT_3089528, partial [Baffinella frigidus]